MGNCCIKWCPQCTCCLPPQDRKPRIITPNVAVAGIKPTDKKHPNYKFKGNKIKTAKYTPWDFIPLNLFKQFQTWSNWFFLFVIVVNFLPGVSGFGNNICWFPLFIVIFTTAVLDAVEDYQRTKSDNKQNNAPTMVYRDGQFQRTAWKHVRVGDLVRVQCNDVIPADLLVVHSSDPNGLCYVETANLDGETNLKQREVIRCLQDTQDFQAESMSCYRVDIEAPNAEVYRINGTLRRQTQAESGGNAQVNVNGSFKPEQQLQERDDSKAAEGESQGAPQNDNECRMSKENLLLRGCKLRNTEHVIGFVLYAGEETKIMMNDFGPALKRSKLESCVQRDMMFCIAILFVLCASGAIGNYVWLSEFTSTEKVPYLVGLASQYNSGTEGTITFLIFIIYLNGIVPLGLSISLQFVKIFQVLMIASDIELYDEVGKRRVACRAWNLTEGLGQVQYLFSDKTGTLTDNIMRFRRCIVNGVDYVFNDARLDANQDSDNKEKNISSVATSFDINSAAVTDLQTLSNEFANLNLNSLLGNSIASSAPTAEQQPNSPQTTKNNENQTTIATQLHQFTFMMSVCNTVIVSPTNHNNKQSSHTNDACDASDDVQLFDTYEAESSDELALVKAACLLGCKLLQRTNNQVSVKLAGETGDVQFDVLCVLPFDSVRKRMSIIVQHPTSKAIVLYCKGADSSVLPLLSQQYAQTSSDTASDSNISTGSNSDDSNSDKAVLARTKHVIDEYANVGLRTLCFVQRVLSQQEYEQWRSVYDAADRAVDNREEQLLQAMQLVEHDFELVGAVGIEDKLQQYVPETIEALRQAGIHVWMLTGDKQETAINIGHSCRLLNTSQQLLVLNESNLQNTKTKIAAYVQSVNRLKEQLIQQYKQNLPKAERTKRSSAKFDAAMEKQVKRNIDLALVIDGSTLQFVLDDAECSTQFLEIARYCKSVLCCRTTPLQKGSVVKLVMDKLGKYSLAVGDGANDVSMIKTANVGVGIYGREGLQASMASDFAVSRFYHLKKLLLVHGHWSYHRYATLAIILFQMQYQFHMLFFWFQIFNGFSAIDPIDTLYNTLYGPILTVLPPIYLGVFDQVLSSDTLMEDPTLYRFGRKCLYYRLATFWICLINGLWQSLVTFFVIYFVYLEGTFGLWEFGVEAYFAGLSVSLLTISIETSNWNVLGIGFMVLSYIIVWIVPLAFNASKSTIASTLPANPYWVIYNHVQTIEFWTAQLACIVLSIVPQAAFKVLTKCTDPSAIDLALVKQFKRKQHAEAEAGKLKRAGSQQSVQDTSVTEISESTMNILELYPSSSNSKQMLSEKQTNEFPSGSSYTSSQVAFYGITSTGPSNRQSLTAMQGYEAVSQPLGPSDKAETKLAETDKDPQSRTADSVSVDVTRQANNTGTPGNSTGQAAKNTPREKSAQTGKQKLNQVGAAKA